MKLTPKQFVRLLYIAVSLGATQTIDGVDAIYTYASEIFANTFQSERSGIYGSLIVGAVNVVCAIIATPLAERFKRKVMLMVGVLGVVLCLIVIGTVYLMNLDKKLTD